jgi:membrane protease subunit HflK
MAWNEPGGNKDPWSRKPKGNSEVDKLINEFSKSFKDLLGGSSGGSGANKKNTSNFYSSNCSILPFKRYIYSE